MSDTSESSANDSLTDPRETLAKWANSRDEWVRFIVRSVLAEARPLDSDALDDAYQLFRQEKQFEERTVGEVAELEVGPGTADETDALVITRLSDVRGVNAIVPGSTIEPHEGLTILYGENGTGKTGYARIFKTLAASRTADNILGDIETDSAEPISAAIDYRVGSQPGALDWHGESGKAPFTRMSIFDSRAVNIHVDDDIEYVYTPAVLSLFQYTISGLRGVQERIDSAIGSLRGGPQSALLSRFGRESTVYPLIETLGPSSDLEALKGHRSTDPDVESKIDALRRTIAALEANTLDLQIASRERAERALSEASSIYSAITDGSLAERQTLLSRRGELQADYKKFRDELFGSADLPADPDETWEQFIRAGATYGEHLDALGVHDENHCLYCRQTLDQSALQLLSKYRGYIEDKISSELDTVSRSLNDLARPILEHGTTALEQHLQEVSDLDEPPAFSADITKVLEQLVTARSAIADSETFAVATELTPASERMSAAHVAITNEIVELKKQAENRIDTLKNRRRDLIELSAAAELAKSWSAITTYVQDAKQADRLSKLSTGIPALSRAVTAMAKTASNELINNSFEQLFLEECASLRAKELKLQFVGREGKAQRRKLLTGKHKPSKVFSEGEQKVLAMADFLAEARLAGIAAPVIFDDPVSSLDYRRVNEVAQRIAQLSEETQVLVFTHDILFTTKLLSLFEKSKRCTYLQISDDGGKGKVTPASGPRWDSLSKLRGKINNEIQGAESETGEARQAHIQVAYSWIRSWCEVFIEQEVLQGVTQRLQPNVAMGGLSRIKVDALQDCFDTVTTVFDDACRYIEGHSQPLRTLSVAPTLDGLKTDWETLQDAKKEHDKS